jgi:hypothetical protein
MSRSRDAFLGLGNGRVDLEEEVVGFWVMVGKIGPGDTRGWVVGVWGKVEE